MATLVPSILCSLIFIFLCFSLAQSQNTYIVHVSNAQKPAKSTASDWYSSILDSLTFDSSTKPDLIYSYTHSIPGFAAQVSGVQAAQLRSHPSVLSVIPDEALEIETTRTPHFLGLADGSSLWPNSDHASDVVVGVLDTGIWPESPSFNDEGYGPVPDTWRGSCEVVPDFPAGSCNRKLIGARAYYRGYVVAQGSVNVTEESQSPRDARGHGTHCASIAAGSRVPDAGFFEYARGEARGVAHRARIAAYKVCWSGICYTSDALAAMDQAIVDGVNVISISFGSSNVNDYDKDSVAIGSFFAAQNGVLVSASAGNYGPALETTGRSAPWMLSVGASSIDREFRADVVLGNGNTYRGASLYSADAASQSVSHKLVTGAASGSRLCRAGELDEAKVAGNIVVCETGGNRVDKSRAVQQARGAGMILIGSSARNQELTADAYVIPSTLVTSSDGNQIKQYITATQNPTATINFLGTVIGSSPSSPRIAAFSSRGPNRVTPEILKPDVIAPGINILAAYSEFVVPGLQFNIISGTSMACPHASGLVALLRQAYPTWSAAAIKSAIMTTAYHLDNSGNNITDLATGSDSTPFVQGSGHVDPNKAVDPGLVYDIGLIDYIAFFCSIGYDSNRIQIFLPEPTPVDCRETNLTTPGNLNYPSFAVVFKTFSDAVTYKRVVKNVASSASATYNVIVRAPRYVRVSVSPTTLTFTPEIQTLSYDITFTSTASRPRSPRFGSIEWTDGSHQVRSPIAASWLPETRQSLAASI